MPTSEKILQSPLIMIGAGRSGSTLLTSILNNQPEISFKGETGFLAPRLWDEVWVDRFWYRWNILAANQPNSSLSCMTVDMALGIGEDTAPEFAKKLGQLFFELLEIEDIPHWGFKEPWIGHPSFDYPWDGYEALFPNAIWLHLMRNPFGFARSTANWNQDALDETYLKDRLSDWLAISGKACERQVTNRYFEVRFEDLTSDPECALSGLFAFLGIEWSPENSDVLSQKYLASSETGRATDKELGRNELAKLVSDIHGLHDELDRYGYDIPKSFDLTHPVQTESVSNTSDKKIVFAARSPRNFQALQAKCLEEQLTGWQNDNESLRNQLQAYQQDNENLRSQLKAYQYDNENLRSQLKAYQHDNENLRSQLSANSESGS